MDVLSQHALSYTMIIIINPQHQADNYHPNMLKPQRYTLTRVYTLDTYYSLMLTIQIPLPAAIRKRQTDD